MPLHSAFARTIERFGLKMHRSCVTASTTVTFQETDVRGQLLRLDSELGSLTLAFNSACDFVAHWCSRANDEGSKNVRLPSSVAVDVSRRRNGSKKINTSREVLYIALASYSILISDRGEEQECDNAPAKTLDHNARSRTCVSMLRDSVLLMRTVAAQQHGVPWDGMV
jgi:hypothetical protein